MKKLHKFIALTTLVTVLTNTGYTQDYPYAGSGYEEDTVAYDESSSTTRWSAYIPVAALIVAAIVLAQADKKIIIAVAAVVAAAISMAVAIVAAAATTVAITVLTTTILSPIVDTVLAVTEAIRTQDITVTN